MNLKTNPELLPLVEWWEKDGKSTVIWCLVIALAIGGWYGYKGHKARQLAAASDSLSSAQEVAELEDAATTFAGLPVEGVQKLRLAKKYFESARYEEALSIYESLGDKAPDGLADVPAVGKAHCLEALGKFAEAQKAFDEFAAANAKHYLTLTAQLGSARCLAQQGKKPEALKAIAALKKQYDGDKALKARIEAAEEMITRWEKQKAEPTAAATAKKTEPVKAEPAKSAKK